MVAKASRARSSEETSQAKLVKALNHELRVQMLTIFTERTASPNELARELDEGLSQVSYHVKVLRDLDLIELVKTEPRRGAVEHYYQASARPLLDTPEWAQLDPNVREAVSSYGIELIIADAARAIQAGTFDSREERHMSRTPVLLDEEGFREAAATQDAALEAIFDAQAASAARMTKSGEEGVPTLAAMLCFEMPGSRSKT